MKIYSYKTISKDLNPSIEVHQVVAADIYEALEKAHENSPAYEIISIKLIKQ